MTDGNGNAQHSHFQDKRTNLVFLFAPGSPYNTENRKMISRNMFNHHATEKKKMQPSIKKRSDSKINGRREARFQHWFIYGIGTTILSLSL